MKTESRKLSIVHLTPHFYWPQLEEKGWPVKFDAMGGMQNQIFRLVNFLDQVNVKQIVITLKIPGAPRIYEISKTLKIISKRIPILPIRSRIRGMVDLNISWFLGVMLFVVMNKRILKKQYNIIHSHCSGVGIPLIAGYLASKILGFPLVTSIHCSAIATYKPMSYLDKYLHKVNIYIEKKVLKKSTHVIFLTTKSKEICSRYVGELSNKTSIISDSIDSKYFSQLKKQYSKKEFVNQFSIPLDKPICIYVGRIAREKGWKDIIYLAKELKDKYHFLIIGNGNEFDLMKEEVLENNLNNTFSFTGYIAQEKVPMAMSLATALILPSRHEEFGSVLLESMTLGLVSIAYNVGGVSNVISHKKDGFLAANSGEMKNFLEEILEDKLLRKNISKNAKRKVKQKFQVSSIGKQLCDVYNKLYYRDEND